MGNEKFLLGNVEDGIVNTEIRDDFKLCNVYAKEECRDCFAKFYCSGGCAANAEAPPNRARRTRPQAPGHPAAAYQIVPRTAIPQPNEHPVSVSIAGFPSQFHHICLL